MNYAELYAAVTERLAVVADRDLRERDPAGHLEKLKAAAFRLDGLVANLPANTDPQLRHFLERQSFVKAQDWLAERVK
jgi:hypothetical protein